MTPKSDERLSAEHKQGCPALGGYGTEDRTCICGAAPSAGEPDQEETIERNPKSWAAWKREADRLTSDLARVRGERDSARARVRVYQGIAGACLGGTDHADKIASQHPSNPYDAHDAAYVEWRKQSDETLDAFIKPLRERAEKAEAKLTAAEQAREAAERERDTLRRHLLDLQERGYIVPTQVG